MDRLWCLIRRKRTRRPLTRRQVKRLSFGALDSSPVDLPFHPRIPALHQASVVLPQCLPLLRRKDYPEHPSLAPSFPHGLAATRRPKLLHPPTACHGARACRWSRTCVPASGTWSRRFKPGYPDCVWAAYPTMLKLPPPPRSQQRQHRARTCCGRVPSMSADGGALTKKR